MASPPFSINIALPGDSDIVSQHPFNARAFRDAVKSWLLVNHDTSGNHTRVDIPQSASPSSPAVNTDVLYVTTTKRLKIKHNDGTEEFVGLPPGAVVFGSGSLDVGYLEADGSAVSRSTFADLFTKIGTTYGVGDGSTTFNLPDIKGRVISGIDSGGVRLTATGLGTAAVLAAVGGLETMTLLLANLPPYTPTGTVATTASGAKVTFGGIVAVNGGGSSANVGTNPGDITITSTYTGAAQGGTSTATKNVQPTIVLRAMIKY